MGLGMADSEMANFYRPFCFLYILKTFVCSLAIAAETRSCALSYGNDLKMILLYVVSLSDIINYT